MDALLGFIAPLFWGFLLLSALVFVHEGGHFLAARACGVRVTEFFLGMPCRFNLHWTSRRIGTKFGITPILLGGYAEICGMDPTEVDCAPQVLTYVHEHGVVSVEQIAVDLSITQEEALEACALLMGWGSLAPRYDADKGEREGGRYYPSTFAAMPRDARGNTIYDGRRFERARATGEGEVWNPALGQDAFFAQERSRTYIGRGFWARAFMLVAGIAVNIVTGFLLVVLVYSVLGVSAPRDVNVVGGITTDSPAASAGLMAGDRILRIDGAEVATWTDILSALDGAEPGDEVALELWRPHDQADAYEYLSFAAASDSDAWATEHGAFMSKRVELDEAGMLGIGVSVQTVRLNPLESCNIAIANIVATAQSVGALINPQHTMDVLDNSTSIVGISVMSAEAAAAGPATFLNLAALISFSLGFMNLLPIPPLDGGKLLIEGIQALTRRQVPVRVQNAISMVGIVLFGLLFIYMFRADILRLFF